MSVGPVSRRRERGAYHVPVRYGLEYSSVFVILDDEWWMGGEVQWVGWSTAVEYGTVLGGQDEVLPGSRDCGISSDAVDLPNL